MFGFLKNFQRFRKTGCSTRGVNGFPPQVVIKSGNRSYTGVNLDEQFLGMLLGVNSQIDTALNDFEKESLGRLRKLARSNAEFSRIFPRSPDILPKLAPLIDADQLDMLAIANLVIQDQALVGDVMRLVSSADYRNRGPVTCLYDAIVLLDREGLQSLIELATQHPVTDVEKGHFVMITSKKLSDQSAITANVANMLCQEKEQQCFHAYLSGLMHNIGFTLGCTVLDEVFNGTQAPNSRKFQQEFVALCLELTTSTAKHWQLPGVVCQLFEMQSNLVADEAYCQMATNLYLADRIAKAKVLGSRIGLDENDMTILVNRMHCDINLKGLE